MMKHLAQILLLWVWRWPVCLIFQRLHIPQPGFICWWA